MPDDRPSDTNAPARPTDRELVLGFRPSAAVGSRSHPRTGAPQYRVVCAPRPDQRAELGPWCATEDRAWAAACLRLGLRLHRTVR